MISQNKAERPLNITSILNNFKSFIKQVYQEEWAESIDKKKDQNNYFRAEISQKEEKVGWLLIIGKLYFFAKIQFL